MERIGNALIQYLSVSELFTLKGEKGQKGNKTKQNKNSCTIQFIYKKKYKGIFFKASFHNSGGKGQDLETIFPKEKNYLEDKNNLQSNSCTLSHLHGAWVHMF